MKLLILTVGVLLTLAGVLLVIRPSMLFGFLRQYEDSGLVYVLAIVVRALLGWALLVVAPVSQFPTAIAALGWLAIVAALFIAAIGPTRFGKLMSAVLGLSGTWGRVAGVFTVLFGVFLIFAMQ